MIWCKHDFGVFTALLRDNGFMAWLEVVRTGPLATVQDRGRRGYGALGVGRSGAVDMISHDSANRLVGNTFEQQPSKSPLAVSLCGPSVR